MSEQKFVLEVTEGPNKGTCFAISGESVLVGRAPECDIRLDSARGISRQHCRIFTTADGLRIQDLESQNGVIIQGKRVKDAIIKPGIAFKVGEVVLLFHAINPAAGALVPGVATAAAVSMNTPPGAYPAMPAAGSNSIEQAQALMETAGESSKNVLLQFIVIIAVVLLGLYLLQMVSRNSPRDLPFALVRAYEEKVVNFRAHFESYKVTGQNMGRDVIRVRDYNGLLADSLRKLSNNPNVPKRRMMIVEGAVEGDARVYLYSDREQRQLISSFKIVCRGINPYRMEEDITAERARTLANQHLVEAAFFAQEEKIYDAWVHYQKAEKYFAAANDMNAETAANVEASVFRKLLSEHLSKGFDDAMAEAFPVSTSVRRANYPQALMLLEDLKNTIPDETSVDRQIIEHWIMIVNYYNQQSKQRK